MSEVEELKKQIYEDMRIEEVLERLGMHNIKAHGDIDYWTCGMPDGDNSSSTVIYNNEYIGVTAYTRIGNTDIIGLVQYVESLDFKGALKWIYDKLNISKKHYQREIGELHILAPAKTFIEYLQKEDEKTAERRDITLYDDTVLDKYFFCEFQDKDFKNDNIPYNVQRHFCLIPYTDNNWYPNDYMVIPIFDEIGNLAGTKLRVTKQCQYENKKYFYPEPCEKSTILYGLYETKKYIDQRKEVIICEAEKGVMQLWNYGYKNAVAVSGHDISKIQKEKIIKLNVDKVVIAFDEDIKEKTLYKEYKKLCDFVNVTCIIDKYHILNEKESPMDNPKKWETLYKECQSIPREFPELELEVI